MKKKRGVQEPARTYRVLGPHSQKKTLNLDQDLLDEARVALGARTETEAVHRALEMIVRRARQVAGYREFLKLGPPDASRIG